MDTCGGNNNKISCVGIPAMPLLVNNRLLNLITNAYQLDDVTKINSYTNNNHYSVRLYIFFMNNKTHLKIYTNLAIIVIITGKKIANFHKRNKARQGTDMATSKEEDK